MFSEKFKRVAQLKMLEKCGSTRSPGSRGSQRLISWINPRPVHHGASDHSSRFNWLLFSGTDLSLGIAIFPIAAQPYDLLLPIVLGCRI